MRWYATLSGNAFAIGTCDFGSRSIVAESKDSNLCKSQYRSCPPIFQRGYLIPSSPLLSSLFDNVPLFNRSRRWTRHTAFTTWVVRFIRIYSPVRSPWSYASKDPALLERRTLCNYKKVRPPFALAPSVPPFPHLVLSFFLPSFPFLSLLLSPSFSFSLSLSFFHDEERAGRAIARGWKTVRCRAAEATEGTGGN